MRLSVIKRPNPYSDENTATHDNNEEEIKKVANDSSRSSASKDEQAEKN